MWLVTLYACSNHNDIGSLHSNVPGIRKQKLVISDIQTSQTWLNLWFSCLDFVCVCVLRDSGNILYPSGKQWLDNLVYWKM